jgi:hypothetical protein
MPSLYAEIEINSPASIIWDTLICKEDWRFWNTFLYDCDPNLPFALGREVFLAMQRIEGDDETEFQPVVTMMQPQRCLKWISRIPGLRSEHSFELQEISPGYTRYMHREVFSGVLSNVFLPFIRQDEKQGLQRMAHQLKRYVERDVLERNANNNRSRPSQDRYPRRENRPKNWRDEERWNNRNDNRY